MIEDDIRYESPMGTGYISTLDTPPRKKRKQKLGFSPPKRKVQSGKRKQQNRT